MNQIERPEQFDIESIRKKIAGMGTMRAPEGTDPDKPLNPYASQIARQFAEENHKPVMVIGTLRIAEALAAGLFWLAFRAASLADFTGSVLPTVLMAALAGAAMALFAQLFDAYHIPVLRSAKRGTARIVAAWSATFVALALVTLAAGPFQVADAITFGIFYALSTVTFAVERVAVSFAIRRWARNGVMERRAVIIGGGTPARDLIRDLESQPDNDIRICGVFDDRDDRRSPDLIAGYPKLGTFDELVEFARQAKIDLMIISLPVTAEERILALLKKLWVLPVDIRIAAYSSKLRFRPRAYSRVGQVAMLDVFDKPITDWDSVAKRIFDVFFAVLALCLLWPIMLVAAIAVKATSTGPVLFMQKRHGFNNQVINVLKFRSMYTDQGDPTARKAVTKNDPRVTPVGRFLRKSSIDELPQLFNVLKGDLSLVGPRPHAVLAESNHRKYADVVENYFARHKVKPGVTGWAQINGWRGEIDNDDKIRFRTAYDLYYIENWSLWFDLKILFLTPFRLLNTENAY